MKQGEVWLADLNPVIGSEQAGERPVVIVSGNLLNQHLPVVIVVPLTTKIKQYKGNPLLSPSKANGLKRESEMLVFHVRSISKNRLTKKQGSVEASVVASTIQTLNDIMKY